MVNPRLIRCIEANWREIAAATVGRIREDSYVTHMARLSDYELREWVHSVLNLLTSWPRTNLTEVIAERFQEFGRGGFERSIPVQEAVRCLHTLKHILFDFTRRQGFAQNAIEIYAQEELEHDVGFLFDHMVFAAVLGYEEARSHAGRQVR